MPANEALSSETIVAESALYRSGSSRVTTITPARDPAEVATRTSYPNPYSRTALPARTFSRSTCGTPDIAAWIERQFAAADDAPVGEPYEGIKGVCVALTFDTAAEAHRVFDALAIGGTVTMPMQSTFWAKAYGMVTDRFGTPWAINGEQTRQSA